MVDRKLKAMLFLSYLDAYIDTRAKWLSDKDNPNAFDIMKKARVELEGALLELLDIS